MAKKYEFQPDKPYATWLSKLQLTRQQQKQVLRWTLYALILLILSLAQDVVLCRFRLYGGTTELVPCGIFIISIMEGTQKGSVFALIASGFYLLSGSAPGPHVLVLVTVMAVFVAALRQTYLHPRLPAVLMCTALAMFVYELGVFGLCLLLGQVTAARYMTFLVPAVTSLAAVPIVYPFAKLIGRIGGETWKE